MSSTAPADTKPKASVKTSYVILEKRVAPVSGSDADTDFWLDVARVTATSADTAIRQHAKNGAQGTYIAIPARSWKPRTIKVETKQIVTLT